MSNVQCAIDNAEFGMRNAELKNQQCIIPNYALRIPN